jgi:hypothetical protein
MSQLDQKLSALFCLKQFELPEHVRKEIIYKSFTNDEICMIAFERLLGFIIKYPIFHDFSEWAILSSNPNITMEIVEKYPGSFSYGSNGPPSSPSAVPKTPFREAESKDARQSGSDLQGKSFCVAKSESATSSHCNLLEQINSKAICRGWNKVGWCWGSMSKNPNLTIDFIEQHKHYNWNWYELSCNPNMTFDIIKSHPNSFDDYRWEKSQILKNPSITMDIIERNMEFWDVLFLGPLSQNPNLTLDFIKKHPGPFIVNNYTITWDWSSISCNPGMTLDIIINHPECPWSMTYMLRNPNLTLDYIENHLENLWIYWKNLSPNPNITIEFIERHLEHIEDWSWPCLSCHPNITMDIIENNPQFWNKWCWENVSENPNITIDFFERHPEIREQLSSNYLLNSLLTSTANHLRRKLGESCLL